MKMFGSFRNTIFVKIRESWQKKERYRGREKQRTTDEQKTGCSVAPPVHIIIESV